MKIFLSKEKSYKDCDKINAVMDFVGIDKFSLLDYQDKISVVLFAKPCNFRCPYCHNGKTILEATTFIPFDLILDYLKSRKGLIDAVVVTGGEPTMMPDLKEKITQIKELGYLVKLDTNGTNPEVVIDLYKSHLVDYVAMDIKNSYKKYNMTCGVKFVDIAKVSRTIDFLINSGIDYEFRTTIIDEYHDIQDIREIAEMVKGAKALYLQKFVDRESCFVRGLHTVPKEKAEKFKEILEQSIELVELRGY